jgi:hypothetical protein
MNDDEIRDELDEDDLEIGKRSRKNPLDPLIGDEVDEEISEEEKLDEEPVEDEDDEY